MQGDVRARHRVKPLQHPQYPPVRVGLHVLVTHFPVQQIFVEFFHPHLAHMEGAAVVALVQALCLPLVYPAHIAHRVGKQRAMGVVPHQLCIHCDAGHAVAVHRQQRALFLGQAKTQGYRLVRTATLQFLPEVFQVGFRYGQQLLQVRQRGVHVLHPLANDRQDVAGPVVRQQYAVTVVNQPALGWQRLQLHTIAVGLGAIDFVVVDLQVVVARQDDTQQGQHQQHRKQRAGDENAGFAAGVLKWDVLWHGMQGPRGGWLTRQAR